MLNQNKSKRSYARVEEELRDNIVRGRFAPGTQLPKRDEMERLFGVGMPTVQKALDALIRDGFVHARTGTGTFVTERPPHLFQYGLVFPDPAFASRFYVALRRAGEVAQKIRGIAFVHYFHHHAADHQRLGDDVSHHRLAGVIFVHPQWDLWDSLAVRTPGVPRAIIAGAAGHGIPAIDVDTRAFYRKAIRKLADQGCKKIAALIPEMGEGCTHLFLETLNEHGLESRPWRAAVVANNMGPGAVSTTTRLLMELADDKRPDGLLILDDNMLEPAISGVLASPVRVPDQLRIVSHCNFPLPAGGALPTSRLGFDCQTFIDTALDLLIEQRTGAGVPSLTMVEPKFESELSAAHVH